MSNIIFKIYGERNSGTCFLTHLLWKNFPNTYTFEHLCNNNVIRYWKHGIPTESIEHCYPHKRKIKIFLYRDLESWLISFYNRPYHLEKKPTFEKFLKEPQVSNEKIEHRFETNKIINDDDNEKNIFDIRYYKLGHILEFIKTHNDCIMVSLSYLQKNYIDFLISLNDEYNLGYDHSTFMPVEKHLKTGKREQNKIYDKTEFESFKFYIESQKNSEIENALPDFLIKQ